MDPNDTLLTIAEISVALAGFSAVVVGLRQTREGRWTRQDSFGVVHILASSGLAMVFSLLPLGLAAAGLSPSAAWTFTSFGLGLVVLVASLGWGLAARRTAPRYPVLFWGFVASGVALGVALILGASGWLAPQGSLLPLALLWLLLVAFTQFASFLALP